MTSDKGQTRPDGIDNEQRRSAPTAQEQADAVLSGQATHVDTGYVAEQPADEEAKPAKKSSRAKSDDQ